MTPMRFAKRAVFRVAQHLPVIGPALREIQSKLHAARAARQIFRAFPPGHFYSPLPAPDELERDAERIFDDKGDGLPGIALNDRGQLETLAAIAAFYDELPFQPGPTDGLRYYFDNPMYSYSDAICLYGMLRHLRPRRIIEIGSGFSSALMLDVNDRFLAQAAECTFIEPYPERVLSLMTPDDHRRANVVCSRLQDVPLSCFGDLEANDVLFVDSSHVLKVGSDVHWLFTRILPILQRGVYVHFHDVFYPFEYPRSWIEEGRYWTEAYALRAFLTFNHVYEIVLFNTYLTKIYRDRVASLMPLCFRNEGGSIWLRRVS